MELDGPDLVVFVGFRDAIVAVGGDADARGGILDSLVVIGIHQQGVGPVEA